MSPLSVPCFGSSDSVRVPDRTLQDADVIEPDVKQMSALDLEMRGLFNEA
jgi:hypothetical protein